MAWALFTTGIRFVLHYLDDFLFFAPPSSQEVAGLRDRASMVFSQLGVPVVTHKTEGPGTRITFLGFELDTVAFQLRLPPDKLERMRVMVQGWRTRQNCTRRELESLAWTFESCCDSNTSWSSFFAPIVWHSTSCTNTIPAYPTQCSSKSRFGMVGLFLTGMEWHCLVSSQGSSCPHVFCCIGFLWLWGSSS